MTFIDRKFNKNKPGYIFQCLLAVLAVFVVLLFLDVERNGAVIASLGASAFIAFTMPHTNSSKPKFLIGGYIVGIISGMVCCYLSTLPITQELKHNPVIFCSLAVGLSIFIMVVTNTEHPPAAGLAMGLFLNNCTFRSITVVLIGIVSLALLKALLRPVLKDLL